MLFEKETSKYSRKFIEGMLALEAARASIDLTEQIGEMLSSANISNHTYVCVHNHCNPTQLNLCAHVYSINNTVISRIIDLMSAVVTTRNGMLAVRDHDGVGRRGYSIKIDGMHEIQITFENKEITREQIESALNPHEVAA